MKINISRFFSDFLGRAILYGSLYLASGSIYLFIEGGARLENYKSEGDSGLVNSFFLISILSFLIYFLCSLVKTRGVFFNSGGKLLIFSLFMIFISGFWADNHFVSFGVGAFLISWYLYISCYIRHVGASRVINQVALFLLLLVCASFIVAVIFPSYGVAIGGHEGSWQGIFTHKNTLGYIALMACVLTVICDWGRFLKAISIAICTLVIVKSKSDAALGFLLLIPSLLVIWKLRLGKYHVSSLVAFTCLACVLISAMYLWESVEPSFLNNRGKIWNFVMSKFWESPIIGHGVYQYPKFAENSYELIVETIGFFVRGAHNGFIDAIYSLGILSLIPITAIFYRAFSARLTGEVGFIYGIFFVYVNIFESNLFSINIFLMVMILIVSIGDVRELNNASQ